MIFKKVSVVICSFLVACTPASTYENTSVVEQDRTGLYAAVIPDTLTLNQAVNMALENNLDARIAEQDFVVSLSDVDLQKLNSLPSVELRRRFLSRNNEAASSSISFETGVESLEPSISSDRSSRNDVLELNWDLVDAAINIYRSKSARDQAEIAKERYRKVLQNIVLDTQSAFYRLGYLQQSAPMVEQLLERSEQELVRLKGLRGSGDIGFGRVEDFEKEIFEYRRDLLELKKLKGLAELELKALLSIPPEQSIRVSYSEDRFKLDNDFLGRSGVDVYVDRALDERPEIREELLSLQIAQRNVKAEIYNTFPGINILAAANNDDNSFLENNEFLNLTATLSQSITQILTLPTRLQRSKNEVELANARRKALVAAVIYQVNIAYAGYADAYNEFLEEERRFQVFDDSSFRKEILKESGLVSGLQAFLDELEYQSNRIEVSRKIIEVLVAQAQLEQSVGDQDAYIANKRINLPMKVVSNE